MIICLTIGYGIKIEFIKKAKDNPLKILKLFGLFIILQNHLRFYFVVSNIKDINFS